MNAPDRVEAPPVASESRGFSAPASSRSSSALPCAWTNAARCGVVTAGCSCTSSERSSQSRHAARNRSRIPERRAAGSERSREPISEYVPDRPGRSRPRPAAVRRARRAPANQHRRPSDARGPSCANRCGPTEEVVGVIESGGGNEKSWSSGSSVARAARSLFSERTLSLVPTLYEEITLRWITSSVFRRGFSRLGESRRPALRVAHRSPGPAALLRRRYSWNWS